jgi:D-alanyl-lipoteichoic acid acyltransferase DltB (MBOAT superfamily)
MLMSLLFYAWGEPEFVLVMIANIAFNSLMAVQIEDMAEDDNRKKSLLIFTIAVNLGIMFIYKYLNFALRNLSSIGWTINIGQIALPIGISFFTFQAMSYVIDVYRGNVKANRNPLEVALYVSLFPQLIAGPIVRYVDVAEQIKKRTVNFDKFSEGVYRFIIGFGKKILLANNMAYITDLAFGTPDSDRGALFAWLGAIAYAFQILFDFSGYSDMAIGLGKMLGFDFLENFDNPYKSNSVSEFWRRWHMSLGSWFRDYVYFPLGGSRVKKKSRLIFNLFVVWMLTGMWHGASWNFIAWGLGYFLLLSFEKLTGLPKKLKSVAAKTVYRIFTLLAVLLGWVVFRAEGGKMAINYMRTMLQAPAIDANLIMCLRERWVFLIICIICSAGLPQTISKVLASRRIAKPATFFGKLSFVIIYMFIFIWSLSYVVLGTHDPFIYFNF